MSDINTRRAELYRKAARGEVDVHAWGIPSEPGGSSDVSDISFELPTQLGADRPQGDADDIIRGLRALFEKDPEGLRKVMSIQYIGSFSGVAAGLVAIQLEQPQVVN